MTVEVPVGQPGMRKMLARAFEAKKVNHALLLTGPAGVGKKSWGRFLSQAILCPESSGISPCGQCLSCRTFCSGQHPYFFFLEPDRQRIKLEQVRQAREHFYLSGVKKVCLIARAETMTAEASSSLLKLLEEPPPDLYFILLAENAETLFDTIRSRCQQFPLQPLDRDQIITLIKGNTAVDDDKAHFFADISAGIPGRAFEAAVDEKFSERYRDAETLVYKLSSSRNSALQLLSWAVTLSEREDLISFLELFCLICRNALLENCACSAEKSSRLCPDSSSIAAIPVPGLTEAVLEINRVVEQVKNSNANRRLLMEKALIMLQRRLSLCP